MLFRSVPLALDLAKSDDDRAILKLIFARQEFAWPYMAPPGVPDDRVAALRQAFLDTMKDKEFLADTEKATLEINPKSGQDIQKLVAELYATPASVVTRAIEMIK